MPTRYKLAFSPEARDDLIELYRYIAAHSDDARAKAYIGRIETHCRGFARFPERGIRRDDLFPGLRIVGVERRVTIAFHIDKDTVTFDRVLYGGRSLEPLFE